MNMIKNETFKLSPNFLDATKDKKTVKDEIIICKNLPNKILFSNAIKFLKLNNINNKMTNKIFNFFEKYIMLICKFLLNTT